MTIKSLAVVLLSAVVCGSCASDSPDGPSGQTCRNYLATGTVQTISSGSTTNYNVSCSFSTQTNALTCVYTATSGGTTCQTQTNSYASKDKFVDEVAVSPPLILRATDATVNNASCGAPSSTTTYTFDAQSRLLSARDAGSGFTTTYSAWDSAGRPTAGSNPGPPSAIDTIVHNASTRQTVTTRAVSNGVVLTTTLDYNANGTITRTSVVTISGGTTFTSTSTTTSLTTASVCK